MPFTLTFKKDAVTDPVEIGSIPVEAEYIRSLVVTTSMGMHVVPVAFHEGTAQITADYRLDTDLDIISWKYGESPETPVEPPPEPEVEAATKKEEKEEKKETTTKAAAKK